MVVVAKMQIREEGTHGRKAVARKGAKETRKVNRTHSSVVSKGRQHKFVRTQDPELLVKSKCRHEFEALTKQDCDLYLMMSVRAHAEHFCRGTMWAHSTARGERYAGTHVQM